MRRLTQMHQPCSRFFSSLIQQRYTKLVNKGTIQQDMHQDQIVEYLGVLEDKLILHTDLIEEFRTTQVEFLRRSERIQKYKEKRNKYTQVETNGSGGLFSSLFSKQKPTTHIEDEISDIHIRRQFPQKYNILRDIPNVYVWGSPGSGKTFLMDLFYETLKMPRVGRYHYNEFMFMIHDEIHKLQKSGTYTRQISDEPVEEAGAKIAQRYNLICLDQFQVLDIADAMILKGLFETLWDFKVVTILTSNRPPKDLYLNGLQRHVFLPFIGFLLQNCDILNLDGDIDYRKQKTQVQDAFYTPIDQNSKKSMDFAFRLLTKGRKPKEETIKVMQGRTLKSKRACEGIVEYQFSELCVTPTGFVEPKGAADFIAIARNYHTVFIRNVPGFTIHDRNPLRRFILLIEELYNASVKVYIESEKAILEMLEVDEESQYDEVFAFERCQSRLIEMGSSEYQNKEWKGAN